MLCSPVELSCFCCHCAAQLQIGTAVQGSSIVSLSWGRGKVKGVQNRRSACSSWRPISCQHLVSVLLWSVPPQSGDDSQRLEQGMQTLYAVCTKLRERNDVCINYGI